MTDLRLNHRPRNWTIGDPEDGPCELPDVDIFNLVYHGGLTIDRRYAPCLFQWIAKKILRMHKIDEKVTAHISRTNLLITRVNDHSTITQDHSFDSIYRLSRLRHCDLDNYFAYIIHEKADTSLCVFHVFECDNIDVKAEFLKSLKNKVLEFQKQPTVCPVDQVTSQRTPPVSCHMSEASSSASNLHPVFRDSVYYIGKVTISQAHAPPKFIDDVIIQLKRLHGTPRSKRSNSGTSTESDSAVNMCQASIRKVPSCDIMKDSSCMDTCCGDNGPMDTDVVVRLRSASMLCDPKKDLHNESDSVKVASKEGDTRQENLSNIHQEVESRLVTFQISKMFLMLFGIDTKTLLLEKKINNISFCTKGDLRSDHFGFICREAGSHICYIFQGESEEKVEAIMKAMKQAFNEALDASAHLTLCESCPLQTLHLLCGKLDSVASIAEKESVIQEYSKCLTEYEVLHLEEKVNQSPHHSMDRIEISINELRELIDEKQLHHKHNHKIPTNITPDSTVREQRPRSQTIFEKAKRSLSNSFQTFTTRKPSGAKSPRNRSDPDLTRLRTRSFDSHEHFPTLPRSISGGGAGEEVDGHDQDSCLENRRSRTISANEVENNVPEKVVEEENEEVFENVKSGRKGKERSSYHLEEPPPKWRQAIYDSISSHRSVSTASLPPVGDGVQHPEDLSPSERARMRWKQAINNQILLIRMDKENRKLAANIRGTEERREKMSYRELGTHDSDCDHIWLDIISRDENDMLDHHMLFDSLRNGVPKARRGDIWKLLIKQFGIRSPGSSQNCYLKGHTFSSLLKEDTNHQHAILIDLGRTFPTYDYFATRLGAGQLSLFNLLKAYSILDKEVGYCQGLSFVAGLFIMHMPEEEAFESFCHLMFDFKLRRQYKPDMSVVQQQLYQLSRLLHDYHPDVTEHLNRYDVTPTLYAAPWFLTLYASQYPIGFVCRVMDLVLFQGLDVVFKVALLLVGNHADSILKCESFESIVEYMKVTIPQNICNETDDVCTRALEMDIKHQLTLYEVEYQLLHEEMIDIRKTRHRVEKQEQIQRELTAKVETLETELAKANETIADLRAQLAEVKRSPQDCFSLNSSCDRDMLTLGFDDIRTTIQDEKRKANNEEERFVHCRSPESSRSVEFERGIGVTRHHFINGLCGPVPPSNNTYGKVTGTLSMTTSEGGSKQLATEQSPCCYKNEENSRTGVGGVATILT